jgi:predicted O-methyltransferase YrrM
MPKSIDSPDIARITKVMTRLEKQSELERSRKLELAHDDLMLAITPDTGKFLNILISAMNCTKILEIGTSVGYSTLCMALAFKQKQLFQQDFSGNIITIEKLNSKIRRAMNNFKEAGVEKNIQIVEGNALTILKKLGERLNSKPNNEYELFDFIFLDADKENLKEYFDLSISLIRKGGIILTDNILFPEDYKPAMSEYLEYVKANSKVYSVTVPIGYGEEMIYKIND